MCGRAAQTYGAVHAAARSLGLESALPESAEEADGNQNSSSNTHSANHSMVRNNYNMSPGMDALVFWKDEKGTVSVDRKVWGLVTRGGSKAKPLEPGMSQHFANLMYNARSDTLYQKPTFGRLATSGKTCLVALSGFFEWKATLATGKGKKQPYYLFRNHKGQSNAKEEKDRPYLLVAGLWTAVPTGREEDPTLNTFTIITTDGCKPIEWLHDRMPLCIWDEAMGLEWLMNPSEKLHRKLEEASSHTQDGFLRWHAVTPDMSSMKFRSEECIKPLPKLKTVKSFFAKTSPSDTAAPTPSPKASRIRGQEAPHSPFLKHEGHHPTQSPTKRHALSGPSKLPSTKKSRTEAFPDKPKKGTLQAYFKPKTKTAPSSRG